MYGAVHIPAEQLVVLVASAGGLGAVRSVLGQLDEAFEPAVALVLHRSFREPDALPDLVRRWTSLTLGRSRDGTIPLAGTIYVCSAARPTRLRPDRSFALGDLTSRLRRPGDDLLVSAAGAYGSHTTAVILSGMLDDGANGGRAVRNAGGFVIAQEPDDATSTGMPSAAIATGTVDFVLPLRTIPKALVALTMAPGVGRLFRPIAV